MSRGFKVEYFSGIIIHSASNVNHELFRGFLCIFRQLFAWYFVMVCICSTFM